MCLTYVPHNLPGKFATVPSRGTRAEGNSEKGDLQERNFKKRRPSEEFREGFRERSSERESQRGNPEKNLRDLQREKYREREREYREGTLNFLTRLGRLRTRSGYIGPKGPPGFPGNSGHSRRITKH